jgi:hypothetical protein
MKKRGLIILALVTVLLLSSTISGCAGITKPSVGYVPPDWYLFEEEPYGTYEESDGTKWGVISYVDDVDWDSVSIFYGDVPPGLQGNENNSTALIAYAVECSTTFEPEETGTMTIAGQLAGFTKAYDAYYDVYEMEIVFVKGYTCIDIYTMFDANASDEAQAMSLINSIDL